MSAFDQIRSRSGEGVSLGEYMGAKIYPQGYLVFAVKHHLSWSVWIEAVGLGGFSMESGWLDDRFFMSKGKRMERWMKMAEEAFNVHLDKKIKELQVPKVAPLELAQRLDREVDLMRGTVSSLAFEVYSLTGTVKHLCNEVFGMKKGKKK